MVRRAALNGEYAACAEEEGVMKRALILAVVLTATPAFAQYHGGGHMGGYHGAVGGFHGGYGGFHGGPRFDNGRVFVGGRGRRFFHGGAWWGCPTPYWVAGACWPWVY